MNYLLFYTPKRESVIKRVTNLGRLPNLSIEFFGWLTNFQQIFRTSPKFVTLSVIQDCYKVRFMNCLLFYTLKRESVTKRVTNLGRLQNLSIEFFGDG
jgi:hypothetical protein